MVSQVFYKPYDRLRVARSVRDDKVSMRSAGTRWSREVRTARRDAFSAQFAAKQIQVARKRTPVLAGEPAARARYGVACQSGAGHPQRELDTNERVGAIGPEALAFELRRRGMGAREVA